MSTSTDGILVYGIDLSDGEEGRAIAVPWAKPYDEDADEDEDDEAIETWWAKVNGIDNGSLWDEYYEWERGWKTGVYSHDSEGVSIYEKLHPEWRVALDKYHEDNNKIQETLPVEEVMHCSYDYSMYFLAVKGCSYSASRGCPEEIKDLHVNPEALAKARAFCEEYDIDFEPKWYLASLWG